MARLGTVRIVDVQDKLCPGVSLELNNTSSVWNVTLMLVGPAETVVERVKGRKGVIGDCSPVSRFRSAS